MRSRPAALDQIVDAVPEADQPAGKATLRSFALNTFGILAAIELAWAAIPPRLPRRRYQRVARRNRQSNPVPWVLPRTAPEFGDVGTGDRRQLSAGGQCRWWWRDCAKRCVRGWRGTCAKGHVADVTSGRRQPAVGLIIAGLVIEVCFALIAACMVLALVESYLIISMGVIFMAFGGTQMDEGLCCQHRPIHVVCWCETDRPPIFGQHRRSA